MSKRMIKLSIIALATAALAGCGGNPVSKSYFREMHTRFLVDGILRK